MCVDLFYYKRFSLNTYRLYKILQVHGKERLQILMVLRKIGRVLKSHITRMLYGFPTNKAAIVRIPKLTNGSPIS